MKKLLCLMLTLALLCAPFAGCGNDDFLPPPEDGSREESSSQQEDEKDKEDKKDSRPEVIVCLDLIRTYNISNDLNDILKEMEGYKKGFKVTMDLVPGEGGERESTLTRIRTEMMSGGGPDVFFCACARPGTEFFPQEEQGLFHYPKALMERNMFLPLDGYMESAQQMDTAGMYPQILDAGKDSQGRQQLLPMGWTTNVLMVDKDKYNPSVQLPITWEEMLASDDPALQNAVWSNYFGGSLGQLADYSKDEPSFTLEELSAHLEAAAQNLEQRMNGEIDSMMADGEPYAIPGDAIGRPNPSWFCRQRPDAYLIPQYNRHGGATAWITAFAAVNANTRQPELAFRVVDTVLSRDNQQNSQLYSWIKGMPVYRELLREDYPVNEPYQYHGTDHKTWRLSDWNHDQLDMVVEQMTDVDFYTPLNHELCQLYDAYNKESDPQKRESLVKEKYTTIQMLLAES